MTSTGYSARDFQIDGRKVKGKMIEGDILMGIRP